MEELTESELGTQEYWDKRYKEEIDNFKNNGDPGEIWFGENVVRKTINWLEKWDKIKKTSKILDLGCGNGMFLIKLALKGFTNLYGVDYSDEAISLAKSIANKEKVVINYSVCNIVETVNFDSFYVIHDKGTFDAISLHANAKEFRMKYIENVAKSLDNSGIFIITSCNWTKDELIQHFNSHFQCIHTIPMSQFQFGGQTGNVVTSLIFQPK